MYGRCTFTRALGTLVSSIAVCVDVYSIQLYVTKLSDLQFILWIGGFRRGGCRSERLAIDKMIVSYFCNISGNLRILCILRDHKKNPTIIVILTYWSKSHKTPTTNGILINNTKNSLSLILYDDNCYFSMLIILMGRKIIYFATCEISFLIAIATDPNFHNEMPWTTNPSIDTIYTNEFLLYNWFSIMSIHQCSDNCLCGIIDMVVLYLDSSTINYVLTKTI